MSSAASAFKLAHWRLQSNAGAAGVQQKVFPSVQVGVNQSASLDFILRTGMLNEVVEVISEASMLDAGDTICSTNHNSALGGTHQRPRLRMSQFADARRGRVVELHRNFTFNGQKRWS